MPVELLYILLFIPFLFLVYTMIRNAMDPDVTIDGSPKPGRQSPEKRREKGADSTPLTERENELVGEYGEVLDRRGWRFVVSESELPAPRDDLRRVLEKAKTDPFYQHFGGEGSLDFGLLMLNTFLPDAECDSTEAFITRAIELAASGNTAEYQSHMEAATESQRRILSLVISTGAACLETKSPEEIKAFVERVRDSTGT